MNKYVKWLLPLLLILACLLTACEEYNPAVSKPGSGNHSDETLTESDINTPVTDESGNVDPNPFTVTLTVEGKPYVPSADTPISVRWSDGFSLHTAPVGSDGTARIGGLDGDYAVTLTAFPKGTHIIRTSIARPM